jgi:hypothetical protein
LAQLLLVPVFAHALVQVTTYYRLQNGHCFAVICSLQNPVSDPTSIGQAASSCGAEAYLTKKEFLRQSRMSAVGAMTKFVDSRYFLKDMAR